MNNSIMPYTSKQTFVFTDLDQDIYAAEKEDLKQIKLVQREIKRVRSSAFIPLI